MWDANGENIVDDIAAFRSANERFEVDGANAAREFLRDHGIWQHDIDAVWTAIALHRCRRGRARTR
jgi:hypothetical protein